MTILYNIMIAPFVLFIRVPILLPFLALAWLGQKADRIGDRLERRLPRFKQQTYDQRTVR